MRAWLERLLGRGGARVEPPAARAAGAEAQAAQAEYRAGGAAFDAGRLVEAVAHLERAVELDPGWAAAHEQLALTRLGQGELEAAEDALVLALHFAPGSAGAHRVLAQVRRRQGRLAEALAELGRAVELDAGDAEALNLLGAWRLEAGDAQAAAQAFEAAVRCAPDSASAHSNLGCVLLRDLGEYERGAWHIERALALRPDDPDVLCNYTMVLSRRGDTDGTIALCERLLAAHPDRHELRLNRAHALLKQGRFAEGWPGYESRKAVRSHYVPRPHRFPEWQGEPLAGRTVLVAAEQGLGDEVMFASCVPDLIDAAGRVILECSPRLEPLFGRSFGQAVVRGVEPDADPSWLRAFAPVDYEVSSGSLPLHFRRTEAQFPRHRGYLVAAAGRVRFWRERLDALGAGVKVGLSWRGGSARTGQTTRSIPPGALAPLFGIPGVRLVSVQYGASAGEYAQLPGALAACWPEAVEDIDECAALMSALDLVISVDTLVVHLAGALGQPVWAAVPAVAEWRYGFEGGQMPWYPSVTVMRQQRPGDWAGVIGEAAGRLTRISPAAA